MTISCALANRGAVTRTPKIVNANNELRAECNAIRSISDPPKCNLLRVRAVHESLEQDFLDLTDRQVHRYRQQGEDRDSNPDQRNVVNLGCIQNLTTQALL